MKKLTVFVFTVVLTLPTFANPAMFAKYEAARQALLKSSLTDLRKSARELSAEASKARNSPVAKQADAVAKSADLEKARDAFSTLSIEMIKVRESVKGARPSVYYCSMVKKSWLQPKGQIGNPYDAGMAMCGELKAE